MTTMQIDRAVVEQALEVLESHATHGPLPGRCPVREAEYALRAALAQQEQEPVAWTDREFELIDGMIEVQLHHAAQCDAIANRTMAEKQKGWDMERVALLHKIKSISPRREWQSLSEEEIHDCFQQRHKDKATERRMIALAVEQALRSKNQ